MDSPSVGGVYYKSSGTSSVGSHTPSPEHINSHNSQQHQQHKPKHHHQQQQHYQNSSFKRNPAATIGFGNRNNMADQSLRGKSQYVKYIEDQQQQQQQFINNSINNNNNNKLLKTAGLNIDNDGSEYADTDYEDVFVQSNNSNHGNNSGSNIHSSNKNGCNNNNENIYGNVNGDHSNNKSKNNSIDNYEETDDASSSIIENEGFQENNNLVLPLGGRLRANSNSKKEKVNAIIW